ncbi:nucleoside diphosphate kinase regulator [Devosia sp. ZB163]|uniref:nucleoside diphosphate kinase regulator n=1 Tax=Devosia sp. ZB163 TaxID=3025938 RepID=UPI0023626978|nr:nucleoside diphosphate kinase regulator [Devosia sp. ZB163]MDC9826351.1 nucleoside diphosphate kinase regulator [Devosia sp. ZB163]
MNITSIQSFPLTPDIVLTADDHGHLSRLAHAALDTAAPVADALLYELGRASVVAPEQLPADVVRMGSTVRYRSGEGEQREVTLVFPAEADSESGLVSVMTPIGVALIGLRRGQSITWLAPDGRRQMLTALRVMQPVDADDPMPPSAA